MDWVLWSIVFASLGGPSTALMLDRAVGISGRLILFTWGLSAVLAVTAISFFALADERPLLGLLVWGSVAGLALTAALDAVRLVGVRLKLFPADMPQIFGAIALGLAPRFQQNVMAQMVDRVSRQSAEGRLAEMRPRVEAISRMSPRQRQMVMSWMMHGLSQLPQERRQAMLQTQMGALSELPSEGRQKMMMTMDLLMGSRAAQSPNGLASIIDRFYTPPPRGLPKVPMAIFLELAEKAIPQTLLDSGTPRWKHLLAGYSWHFLMGATFGISYTLLFGNAFWPLAFAWGTFVWLAMMVVMPPMMPMIKFPTWFPIWPFLAHMAMAAPLALFAQFISDWSHTASAWGTVAGL